MKKLLFILAMSVTTMAFAAAPENVNVRILETFKSTFSNVTDVKWSPIEKQGLYKAEFVMNGQDVTAVFSEEGELMATARYINRSATPIMIARKVGSAFPGYHINTVIEKTTGEETSYFVTIDSAKQAYVVEVTAAGELSVTKKIKK